MNDDIDDASASIPDKKCGAYHENYRMIPWSYDSMTSRYSLPQQLIGQLCIAIRTNRSTPHRMLVAAHAITTYIIAFLCWMSRCLEKSCGTKYMFVRTVQVHYRLIVDKNRTRLF